MVDAKALRSRRGSLLLQTADAAHAECLASSRSTEALSRQGQRLGCLARSRRAHKARAPRSQSAQEGVKLIWRHVIEAVHAVQCCEGRQAAKARMLVDPLLHGSFVCTTERVVKESRQADFCMDPLGRIPRHTHVNDIVRQEPWQPQPCCQDKICVSFYFLACLSQVCPWSDMSTAQHRVTARGRRRSRAKVTSRS